jgi:hypothetical protein
MGNTLGEISQVTDANAWYGKCILALAIEDPGSFRRSVEGAQLLD